MNDNYENKYVILTQEEYDDMIQLIAMLKQELYKQQKPQS